MKNIKRNAMALAGAFALLSGGAAHADLLEYSFTGADGSPRTVSADENYVNPEGTINFALSAGVDRKVRISILDSSGAALSSKTSQILGANDRISVGGREYYGDFLALMAPGEGSYTLKAEILAGDNTSVKTDTYPLTVDTTPPTASAMTATNSGYEQVATGNVWKLGLGGSADTFFRVTNVTDESPIEEARISLYREDGSLHFDRPANYDIPTQQVDVRNDAGFFPSSNLDENFKVQISVKDKAGNVWKSQSQTVRWDSIANAPSAPFGVFDPNSNNVLGPGLNGFEPYKSGMKVKTNPIRLGYRVPKDNWHEYTEGGISLVNGLGEKSVVGTDSEFVYIIWSGPYGNTNNNATRWSNFGQWGGGSIQYNLKLSDSAPKTPIIKSVEYRFSDVGWHSFYRQPIDNSLLPLSFDKIRVNAEARNFDQLASHRGTCTIPAGETSCIINASYTIERGTTGYIHNTVTLRSVEDRKLLASYRYAEVNWNDKHYPALDYQYDESQKELTVFVTQPGRGSYFDRLRLKSAWIEDDKGNVLSVSGGKVEENGQNYTYKWDLKTLPEGDFKLVAAAKENHGPQTRLSLFPITSDRTPPELEIKTIGGEDISSLDQFLISVSDSYDTEPKLTSVRLEGGPASDNVQLSWREETPGAFRLEYPIMFPSLKAGEKYTLTVTAEDAQGNASTESADFMYQPVQMRLADGMDGRLLIPAVAQEFLRLDGGNIIQTDPIKLGGDTVVSGTYDVFATLRSDAEVPLVVNGIRIEPGQTMSVMSQHDFSTSGGRINLPLRPAVEGVEGSSNLLVMTSAPNSPVLVLDVNTWAGKAKLSAESWEVRQVIDPVNISASPEAGVACRLTSDVAAAQGADAVRDPVCLLEWEQTPDEAEPVEAEVGGLKLTGLQGQAVALGEQPVSYSLYLFSGDGRKIRVGGGERILTVGSAFGSVAYKPMDDVSEVHRVIDEFDVRMKQSVGPACRLTLDATQAQDAASKRQVGSAANTCLFEWIDIPDGMQQDPYSENPNLFGSLREKQAHTLRWRVSIFTRNGTRVTLATESYDIEAVDPPLPTLDVMSSYQYEDDLFMVPTQGGYLGDAVIQGQPTPLDVRMHRDSEVLTNETFQPGRSVYNKVFRRMETEESALWEETVFDIEAAYSLLPEVKMERTLRAIAVPGDHIRPRIEVGVNEALDTAPLPVTVRISDGLNPEAAYDPSVMGEWSIRLVREESFDEVVPMTDYVDAPNGEVQFNLDLSGIERSLRLVAQARLKSPIEGYDRTEDSRRLSMTVLRGGAIDASVDGRRLAGAAPFSTILQLELDNRADIAATGDVVWEVSSDDGATWESQLATDRNRFRFYKTYEKGEYLVRAKVLNVNSKAESYTETIQVVAYNTPEVKIEGARTLFVGTEATYTAKVTGPDGKPMENAVIKWTQDRGETFFHEGDTLTLSSDEAKRFSMEVWVRDETAPDGERYSYTRKRVSADFRPAKGPRVFMSGPRVIEVGKDYEYAVRLSLPYNGMEGEIEGYFTLPNGDKVEGDTLTYSPTEEDLVTGRIELGYIAWMKGYRDLGTEASREIRARVWQYVWPDFSLYMRGSMSDMAPATISARVREIAFRGQLDEPEYRWEFPSNDGFTVTEKRWDDMRSFLITEPGTYPVKVTISDARGNVSVIEETLEVGEAPPYDVQIKHSTSNDYSREPLELRMRPYVTGGHPRDRVVERIYKVNGQEVDSAGYSARTVLEKGSHEVALTVRTRMGKEITETLNIDVAENQPPVCSIRVNDRYSSWTLYAECEDVDGSVRSFEWTVNGEPVSVRSNRLTLLKRTYDDVLPRVELIGYDDAGDASAKVQAK